MPISERKFSGSCTGIATRVAKGLMFGMLAASFFAPRASALQNGEVELGEVLSTVDLSLEDSRREGADRVAALGVEVLPSILSTLGRTDDPSGTRRDVLLRAVKLFPRPDVNGLLQAIAVDDERADLRPGAINLLGGIGSGGHLNAMLKLATTSPEDLADDFRSALAELLRRDPGAFSNLWSTANNAENSLLPAIVDAVTDVGDARGLPILSNLLIDNRRIAYCRVLPAISSIAETAQPPFDMRVQADVRRVLEQAEGKDLAEAARSAARLEDFEVTAQLIELLDSDNPQVKTEALEGLRYLTGLNFRSDSRRWTSWLESEHRWWREEAPALIDDLDSSDSAKVLAAVNAIVTRRLFRGELAGEVARLLGHPDAGVRSLACSAMGELGSYVEIVTLIDCLDDPEPAVRTNAEHALKRITRLDLSQDSTLWREALQLKN